jgi:Undecaprenyl-phosphate glucose phosphotransferase
MQPVGNTLAFDKSARARPLLSLGWAALSPIACCADVIVLTISGLVAPIVYDPVPSGGGAAAVGNFLGFSLVSTLTFVALSYLTGAYEPRAVGGRYGAWSGAAVALRLWVITLGFMALCAFMLKVGADFSRGTVAIYATTGGISIVALRRWWPAVVRLAIDRNLIFVTKVFVLRVGGSARPADAAQLTDLGARGLQPSVVRDLPAKPSHEELSEAVARAESLMRGGRIQEIVVAATDESVATMDPIFEALRVVPVPIRLILTPRMNAIYGRKMDRAGSILLAEYQRAPFSTFERALKRALDLAVASTGLLVLSPLFILTAIAVRVDSPGPVLFRQMRRGFGGKTFQILKFRSMTVADNGPVIEQAKKNDARVTRVGKLIRRTSIDELPQLLNVLSGQMSIVGPRPHAVAHDDYYARFIETYAFRHHAKPGLTGWAQVKGLRGETPKIENMEARIEKDLWYINNWSIWLDMVIILRTVLVVLRQKTAY